MIVMVTGGRDFDDERMVRKNLLPFEVGDILLVGGASGADELARKIWHEEKELPYIVHPAPWSRAGRAAGPMRNHAMITGLTLAPYAKIIPHTVLAFPGERGTRDAIGRAEAAGITVVRAL